MTPPTPPRHSGSPSDAGRPSGDEKRKTKKISPPNPPGPPPTLQTVAGAVGSRSARKKKILPPRPPPAVVGRGGSRSVSYFQKRVFVHRPKLHLIWEGMVVRRTRTRPAGPGHYCLAEGLVSPGARCRGSSGCPARVSAGRRTHRRALGRGPANTTTAAAAAGQRRRPAVRPPSARPRPVHTRTTAPATVPR